MKNLIISLFSLLLIGFAGTALAKKDKSIILHCGCAWDGEVASMVYGENNISSKSRGHDAHLVGTVDACKDGEVFNEETQLWEDTFSDFVRNGDDCQLSGPPLGDPIFACVTQEEVDEDPEDDIDYAPAAGDSCGVEALY
jgi:hypothetical protein